MNLLKHGSKIEFDYDETNLDMEINIPLIYYKGYVAKIEDKDGNVHKLYVVKNDKNCHVLVKSDEKLTGKITVEYKMTLIQMISYLISITTFICLIVYIIIDYRKKNLEKV